MKRILILLATLTLFLEANAQKSDSARFYYVLQNPKFYGLEKARSWFEIDGLKDKKVQDKINAQLRAAYYELTELDTNSGQASLWTDKKTPKGFSDYTFYNGQTYGDGWVRFKDSDSLLRLNDADGYYGSGTNLAGFWFEIAHEKLAWIQISPSGYRSNTTLIQPINLGFHLGTGDTITTVYTMHLDPMKRDTLEKILDNKVLEAANNSIYHNPKILSRHHLSDTVSIPLQYYIQWLNGNFNHYATVVTREFEVQGSYHNSPPMIGSCNGCLSLTEAIPFVKQDEWNSLQEIYR